MAISVKNNVFTLQTKNSTYQMKADERRVLLHTYYGAKTDETDHSYLIQMADHGFSGNIAGTEDERVYSLDYLPQEFPVLGSGDHRIHCLAADLGSGVCDCLLLFDSYKVYDGKYSIPGLPAMFAGESAQTLEILLKDCREEFYVRLLYGVFEDVDIITRSVVIENRMEGPAVLKKVSSACVDLMENGLELVHFYGRHGCERQMEKSPLPHGIMEVRSTRGASSHQHNPFVILAGEYTTEESGICYGAALLYSGGFSIQAEVDQVDQTRLILGIDAQDFSWELGPQECFYSPEVCMCMSSGGYEGLSHRLHRGFQDHLIRSAWKDKRRPIVANNWEATHFDFDGKGILDIAREAAGLGVDMFVLDDGWFGKRDSDLSGLGDWYANEEKLGCTLSELSEEVHEMGLMFGLWFEPEMISEDSDLYREHPDWALAIPGRVPIRGRSQLVLDMSRGDVIDHLYRRISGILDTVRIEYIKWDMNRSLAAAYSRMLPAERQGEVRHRSVLGVYELLERILKDHPGLLLEGCCGGGGRYDAGMLHYCPQIWCSDNTDAIERLRIQYGTSFAYPISTISAHVSACPNEMNFRTTPFKTRGVCAMQGVFGYELDLRRMSQEEKEAAKTQIAYYKEHYRLFQFGTYHRLVSPYEDKSYTAWGSVAEDQKEAVVAVVYTDLHANPRAEHLKLRGLVGEWSYRLCRDGEELGTFTGAALMNGGILLSVPKENYDSCQYYLKAE